MPDSDHDFEVNIGALERQLRAVRRDITGLAEAGKQALDTPEDTFSFEARLEANLEDWQQFLRAWNGLVKLKVAAGVEFPDTSWQRAYDATRDEIREGKALLMRIQHKRRALAPLAGAPLDATLNVTTCNPSKPPLPKIPIPTFSGDRLKCTHFKDTFLSLVHNEPTLSNIEKFHYLLGALQGEAAVLVSRFAIQDDSYPLAWDKVVKTYDNPRVLASFLVNRLLDSQPKANRNEYQRYSAFLTEVADSLEAFRALNLENPGEFLLSTLVLRALDHQTRRQFEISIDSNTFPSADDVIAFIRQRKSALEMSQGCPSSVESSFTSSTAPANSRPRYPNRSSSKYQGVTFHATCEPGKQRSIQVEKSFTRRSISPTSRKCLLCSDAHPIYKCQEFLYLPTSKRVSLVKGWKVCVNCLNQGHRTSDCRSKFQCRHCKRRHHTLIHEENRKQTDTAERSRKSNTQQDQTKSKPLGEPESFIGFGSGPSNACTKQVLLGTASVLVKGNRGTRIPARALIDSGSQHSFITSSLARKIGADVTPFSGSISSLAGCTVPKDHFKGVTSCILHPYEGQPIYPIQPIVVDRITATLPSKPLPSHIRDAPLGKPLADRRFGFPGPIDLLIGGDLHTKLICGASQPSGVEDLYLLQTTFGLVVSGQFQSPSEQDSTHTFFTESQSSVEEQLKRFWELEEPTCAHRTDPEDQYCEELAISYSSFMQEYLSLGHMSLATHGSPYIIPHHCIWKEGPDGAKLRVVFDASCPSASASLNDALLAGPKLQNDICSVLTQFRLYAIPLCADIVKMYRQIIIHRDDRPYQHIFWRNSPSQAVKEYELNTVTYGVKSSAFQAIRVIQQLVSDEGAQYPLAASRVLSDMYVDVLVSGADSIHEARQLQRELIALFQKGGFALSKWASSITELLPPSGDQTVESVQLTPSGDHCLKILGLVWNPLPDAFSYTVCAPPTTDVTKRAMLSAIARIFDPLGLLAPVIFTAKLLIQEVWKEKLHWDDILPNDLSQRWNELIVDWHTLATITVPRHISASNPRHLVVGFCDASEKGYAAALYLRTEDTEGICKTFLLKAKTKVAPLKYVSIARLELCGALLLSRLISSAPQAIAREFVCFTDSQVVLSWLNTPTYALKVFEANRVAQILNHTPANHWYHVKSGDNPADLASRGCSPTALRNESLWWYGPEWMQLPCSAWLTPRKDTIVMTTITPKGTEDPQKSDWLARTSSYLSAVRIMSRLLRFVRRKAISPRPNTTALSAEEFRNAEMRCIELTQKHYLPQVLYHDASKSPKPFHQLNPFVDERGIIRVGGRLDNSDLMPSTKNPILLPRQAPFSRMLIHHLHTSHFLAGQSLTLALLRAKYWIPRANQLIRSCIIKCIPCRIRKAKPAAPLMAPLPSERVCGFRAFTNVGVDYAGPFLIKESSRRNAALGKAYLCLFVCMASKAVHLELVPSLSTPAFLSALERFISRRGVPNSIWSDNGTNFVGASRFLKDLWKFQQQTEAQIAENLALRGIEWKFIPRRAPHFGGLWEAGIKSVKGLLAGSIGKQPFTFEELSTAFTKIEALLNSRPLCALTEDAGNFDFLTPGHFLVGSSLGALPEPSKAIPVHASHRDRWQIMQSQIAHVWKRWRREYLHTLQQRSKWTTRTPNFNVGELVILLEKRTLTGQWPVGRIFETHPGRDGITRTVTLKTPSGSIITRAVSSLVPLFHNQEDSS